MIAKDSISRPSGGETLKNRSILIMAIVALLAVSAFVPVMSNVTAGAVADVNEEGIFVYEGVRYKILPNDEAEVTTGNDCSGDVVIPDIASDGVNNYKVTKIAQRAFDGCNGVTAVTIGANVAEIDINSFNGCKSLLKFYVAKENTTFYTDGDVLCKQESGEKTLVRYPLAREGAYTISDDITTLSDFSFGYCNGLTSVTIPVNVTKIGEAFYQCNSLTSIDIHCTAEKHKTFGNYAISRCSSLTSVHIPKYVEDMGSFPFFRCNSLESITVEEGNVGSYYTDGGVLFQKINGKTILWKYPQMMAGKSYEINNAQVAVYSFSNCANLESVTTTGNVTFRQSVFYECPSLKSLTVPDNMVTIPSQFLYGCTSLTSFNIPDSVTEIESSAFDKCSSLTSLELPNDITSIGEYCFRGCSSLTSLELPSGITEIKDNTFADCKSLVSINIPDNVTKIGVNAFAKCASLKSVEIPAAVASIGDNAFSECLSLTSINVAQGNTNYSSINGVLYHKTNGTVDKMIQYPAAKTDSEFTIPDNVELANPGMMFFGNTHLTAINVDPANTHYSSVNGVLFSHDGKTLIQYPAGKTDRDYELPSSVTSISEGAFFMSIHLVNISVKDNNGAFSSVNGCLLSGDGATFLFCPAGKGECVVPGGVTTVNKYAISGPNVTSVVLPDNKVIVSSNAMYDCTNLSKIVVKNMDTTFRASSIIFFDKERHTIHLFAPEGYDFNSEAISGNVDLIMEKPEADNGGNGVVFVCVACTLIALTFIAIAIRSRT